jgi:hypothetical protein
MDVDEEPATTDARAACRQLLERLYAGVDAGRATDGLEVFAPDALMDMPSGAARGAEQIARALSAREAQTTRVTVHAIASFDFRLTSQREAAASGSLVVYAGAPGDLDRVPEALTRYAAEFHRGDDGWRTARLEVRVIAHDAAVSR